MSSPSSTYLSAGKLQFRLTLLFLALAACLIGLFGLYWFKVLEPQLLGEAQASAASLAQSQSQNLAEALLLGLQQHSPQKLADAMDEVLVLVDPNTRAPFVTSLEVTVNSDAVTGDSSHFNLRRGAISCPDCFVTRIPLYSRLNHELLGAATFHSSSLAFRNLHRQVRTKLIGGSVLALTMLLFVWYAVTALFRKVKKSEEAAAAATQAKSDFLATMSHEIRTPMNAILGMTHLLERSTLDAEQQERLHTIASSGEALLVILNDILDLSRIEAGKLTLETKPFDLAALVCEVVNLMSGRAQEKELALTAEIAPDIPQALVGDSARLRQVLLNLVGNAIKFTEQGSVTIRLQRLTQPPASSQRIPLELAVIDTGIGIAAEHLATLFQPFSQADSGISRRFGGSGLGLAICKRLLEAMGGTIQAKSTFGEGSTFNCRLELEPAELLPDEAVQEEPSASLPPLTILVTDDQEINRKVVASLLTQEGHTIAEASGGEEAVTAAQQQNFDVILMDLQMPGMDGLEATRRIRALETAQQATVPIIALTANILNEERDRCLRAGMDGFIVKPFTPEGLNHELSRVLASRTQINACL